MSATGVTTRGHAWAHSSHSSIVWGPKTLRGGIVDQVLTRMCVKSWGWAGSRGSAAALPSEITNDALP